MALVLKDRVKETTTTTGTGTYTLAGAVTGFEAFSSVGDGNTTYYSCTDGTDFEVGIGTYTASGTTLARTTILQSSNSDSAVSWSSGTKTIFCAQPAEKAVFLDANGDITLTGASYNLSEFLNFGDSGAPNFDNRLRFGDGVDLSLFSDGTNGFLQGANNNDLFVAYDEIHLLSQDYSKTRIKINSSDAVELYHNNSKKLETTADGVTITSTDAGADAGPVLKLNRDSASPASNDFLGEIQFDGDDAGGNSTTYAKITGVITTTTDGSEDGRIKFDVLGSGSFTTFYQIGFGGNFMYRNLNLMHNVDLVFEGGTDDSNETTLTVTDPTADRTITLPDATGTVALTSDLGTIASQAADSVNIDGGAIDGVTIGTNSAVTELQVDNININGNDITCTNSNGAIGITPNGTGDVFLSTDTVHIGDFNSNAKITTNGTGDLTLNTNSGTNSGSIVIADGANGNISITPDGTGSVVVGRASFSNQIQLSQVSGNAIVTTGDLSNADLGILRARNTSGADTHGFTIKYMGSRSGNNNSFSLFMDNQTSSDVEAITVLQDGKVGILNTSPGSALDVTGEIAATSLDISGDVDVDGTLEADAMTLNGTAITTTATLSTGISNGNVPVFTSGAADNDFLRIDGTSIEGRSASEVLSDIGATTAAAAADEATALAIALG